MYFESKRFTAIKFDLMAFLNRYIFKICLCKNQDIIHFTLKIVIFISIF